MCKAAGVAAADVSVVSNLDDPAASSSIEQTGTAKENQTRAVRGCDGSRWPRGARGAVPRFLCRIRGEWTRRSKKNPISSSPHVLGNNTDFQAAETRPVSLP